MGTLILTDNEQRRADVLTRLMTKTITTNRAAQLLGVTPRQVRRLRHAYTAQGLACLVHGNRGRRPANALAAEQQELVRRLAGPGGPYHGFNHCHLRDLLQENHQLALGRTTLMRLLNPTVAVPSKPTPQTRRSRRLRCAAQGEMVQMDGSLHDWLEGRGPRMCLLGAIDDATGKVLSLRFWLTECAAGYLYLLREVACIHGLPMSYYHDKHTILRAPAKETIDDQLAGRTAMSQVQRVMHELGIESIAAHSPQAKGRIERLWKTFQDRLIKEMRLAGIATMEEANAFLPGFLLRYNAQFAVEPADPTPAWEPLLPGTDLDYHFSMVEMRVVKEDHTISFNGKILQVTAASRTRRLAGQRVTVRINPEGEMALYDGKRRLEYRPVSASQPKPKPLPPLPANPKKQPTEQRLTKGQAAWLHAPI